MLVYVLNKDNKPLMPCTSAKARVLLKLGKSEVIKRTPFTIRLKYGSSGYKQKLSLGVDSGFNNIGLSVISDKKEVYTSEVKLRTDIVDLNSERRSYRRTRRNRKTRYRKPRFLNRVSTKKEGWLAPSIRHKIDSHIKVINNVLKILPITEIIIEVANFDIQKIKNPDISSTDYQAGDQLGFSNVREYVLFRDNHKCLSCKGKSKDNILNIHHLTSRKTGGNRPDNLVTLCKTCHNKFHNNQITLKVKPSSKGFKAETFMTSVRWKILEKVKESFDNLYYTYGHITKSKRIELKLKKSHKNDAFIIAGAEENTIQLDKYYLQKQVRKQNRKLFKGIRSHIKNTASRFIKGFQRYDKVIWNNIECFIFGRRTTGYFDLRDLNGNKIHSSAKAKDCKLVESCNTILIQVV